MSLPEVSQLPPDADYADELELEGNESEAEDEDDEVKDPTKKSCPRGPANHISLCAVVCDKNECKSSSGSENGWDKDRIAALLKVKPPPLFSPPPLPKFSEPPDLREYCAKGVFIWAPLEQFPGCYRCSDCNGKEFRLKGSVTRYIHGIDCGALLVSRRHECAACAAATGHGASFYSHDEDFLMRLPECVRAMFPCVLTDKHGATKELVRTATMLYSSGLSIGKIGGIIRKRRVERWVSKASDYMNHLTYWKQHRGGAGTMDAFLQSSSSKAAPTFPQLMQHCEGYNEMAGSSHQYLKQLVEEEILLQVKPHADAIMAGVTGCSFAFDQTHTVASRVQVKASNATSEQPFDNLIAIVNEKSMIASYAFCSSTEHIQQQNMVKSLQERGCTPQMY